MDGFKCGVDDDKKWEEEEDDDEEMWVYHLQFPEEKMKIKPTKKKIRSDS